MEKLYGTYSGLEGGGERVLVTGATGFVGRELCSNLVARGYEVVGVARHKTMQAEGNISYAARAIGPDTEWQDVLSGVSLVVHLAARVHVMHETSLDPLVEFRRVNVAGTERLAHQAASAGVRRFVYVSSIKVNGEKTELAPFAEGDSPHPEDPYAISKWEAEQALQRISDETGLEVVIVRPPLVYGPGVAGNFLRLLNLVDRQIPLPFGAIENHRSLIYLGNLVDALMMCLAHPDAANKVFLVKDGEDVSTPQLIRSLAGILGKKACLLSIPPSLMRIAGRVVGKSNELDRLLGSLVLDDSKIRRELRWEPPFSMQQGLRATAEWFNSR
jgi:nucleoside-diphosphate-sugar epimerase